MLAIKVFSVLVNSMPDERTGSKITWFNSPLCANQDVSTLVNMIQVGQWYGVHKVREKFILTVLMPLYLVLLYALLLQKGGPKQKCHPTVKFWDIEKDLMGHNLHESQATLSGPAPLQPHELHDSDSDNSDDLHIDNSRSGRSIIVQEHDSFQVDDDVDLASEVLKSMFVTADPSAAEKAPHCDPAPENSFVCDTDTIDWDF